MGLFPAGNCLVSETRFRRMPTIRRLCGGSEQRFHDARPGPASVASAARMNLKRVNSLLAYPDGDDAVAFLLQGHAAVVISVGASLSAHGSARGVLAPR